MSLFAHLLQTFTAFSGLLKFTTATTSSQSKNATNSSEMKFDRHFGIIIKRNKMRISENEESL